MERWVRNANSIWYFSVLIYARYDFKNKKIGMIGGGSSSVQIVPKLQAVEGAQLSCFIRSKMWISNPFGDYVMDALGLDKNQLECS